MMVKTLMLGVVLLLSMSCVSSGPIKKVFVVWSNHLDIGYTDNLNGSTAGAVINRYFHDHFPKAIDTAKQARAEGKIDYKWMTHSWLVNTYRNCEVTKVNVNFNGPSDLICPNASAVAAFEAAVRRGDIVWHAFPFNSEPEVFNTVLFDAALNMTFREDDYFGLPHKRTLSQRDVPGLTRAAIPLLARRNVTGVSVGENSQCAPMAVPPIFLWKDLESNTEVVALFHALGYGRRRRSNAGDVGALDLDNTSLFYTDTNGDTIMTDLANPWDDGPGMHIDEKGQVIANRWEHCVEVDAAEVAVCYAWKVDNSGPHSYKTATILTNVVHGFFPNVTVVSSNAFDDFIEAVLPYKDTLPVVTAELGDTWMMGANSDPLKVAQFRAATRVYSECFQNNNCLEGAPNGSEATLRTFERQLMTVGEHTWGWNGGDIRHKSWKNAELKESLSTDDQFKTAVLGWIEQRNFLGNALAVLPSDSLLSKRVTKEFKDLLPPQPFNTTGFVSVGIDTEVECGDFKLRFSADGAASSIQDKVGTVYADSTHTMFRVHYHNMDHDYITNYAKDYVAGASALFPPEVFAANLVKPNMNLPSLSANATLVKVRWSAVENKVLLDMTMPMDAHTERGAPSSIQAMLHCANPTTIDYTLRWFNKTATHAPETIWLSNVPPQLALSATPHVTIDKLGSDIDPLDADLGCDGHRHTCGVHLHGVGDGGACVENTIKMVSIDSVLLSTGTADPVPTPLVRPDVKSGIHFALVGNIWNTNYPFWYPFVEEDSSSQFRFNFTFGHC